MSTSRSAWWYGRSSGVLKKLFFARPEIIPFAPWNVQYRSAFCGTSSVSFGLNPRLDLDAAMRIAAEFTPPTVAIIKHNNPCGVAISETSILDAYRRARETDPADPFAPASGLVPFLTAQRKDLVESIAQTSEAIKRIDETTRQRFVEAFAAINRNFQETFSTLFGGGRAGLTLIDETDPLESGIEIIAQPPGKRLQSVQLLSGGEKALSAIALMFAMFKYKPSPFCLLDEIDAPLDDANIGRFVEMLRGMQLHTQFIVITHNRKTMEIADRLYGVTMEEPGVSKLISVQLN